MKRLLGFIRFVFVIFLLILGLRFWYENLNESKKRFIKNFLSQVPELPGRYAV